MDQCTSNRNKHSVQNLKRYIFGEQAQIVRLQKTCEGSKYSVHAFLLNISRNGITTRLQHLICDMQTHFSA
jgi:hypothetical protein